MQKVLKPTKSTSPRVVITGAASGLGLALTRRWLVSGARVLMLDIDTEALALAREQLLLSLGNEFSDSVSTHTCDVRQEQDFIGVRKWIEKHWAGLDILINNAGVASHGSIDDSSIEDWQWVLDINLLGVVRGCRQLVPLMKKEERGYIVNTSSMAGLLSVPEMSSYAASKAAVVSLSETLRSELADWNIGVSVVCPSFFQTNLGQNLRSPDDDAEKWLERLLSTSDLSSSDIANIIFNACQQGQFLILPHKRARQTYRIKRLFPLLYWREAVKIGRSIARRRRQK